ncbi:hypothetical protein [Duganella violaceipulchra]|uniref:Uncharacterized protein n=1 Tax=Duganella violaceipulchra TaxID=2849652 RepID=A0AA41HB48_9BURK|nr:hypothetical protein [Duganella violaceicalia]MBV6325293.1 hypothetical protein [Duganella violaceicalia]MCP2012506.1 hypothetical protein [Duganella violaceicalia]
MNKPRNEILVNDIAGEVGLLECANPALAAEIRNLGFAEAKGVYSRRMSDMNDRRDIVRKLVALGALFSGGRDWSPAEIVTLFSEEGFIKEKFRTITWKEPNEFLIVEHEPAHKS